MKNTKKIFVSLLILIVSTSSVIASNNPLDDKTKNKLTKEIFVTTAQVNKDFWKELTEKLDTYFVNIRYHKDKESIEQLNKALEPLLEKYNKKTVLNENEKKTHNLVKNLFYRWTLISKYYIQ